MQSISTQISSENKDYRSIPIMYSFLKDSKQFYSQQLFQKLEEQQIAYVRPLCKNKYQAVMFAFFEHLIMEKDIITLQKIQEKLLSPIIGLDQYKNLEINEEKKLISQGIKSLAAWLDNILIQLISGHCNIFYTVEQMYYNTPEMSIIQIGLEYFYKGLLASIYHQKNSCQRIWDSLSSPDSSDFLEEFQDNLMFLLGINYIKYNANSQTFSWLEMKVNPLTTKRFYMLNLDGNKFFLRQYQDIQEGDELNKHDQCIICMDRDADITFNRCGHSICCSQCSKRIQKCPLCRKVIKGQMKKIF